MKNKGYWQLLGFILFVLGFSSLIMQLVGIYWAFLRWMEWGGGLLAFVLKIFMIIGGVLCIVLGRTDWESEKRESSDV